ncbi:MAG: tRNA (guanosine(46)-N7)-methyltransferase TrmB [Planctomycetes bacterium]|nr:tRNA (guanosine(46)-N7)-methyltransferase TrmB [Planctomycetota bacterium]MBL7106657.1 tRNA (guanosine(46)-N7)-methyltransferase TrmB [Phycisphaerae bacterium]
MAKKLIDYTNVSLKEEQLPEKIDFSTIFGRKSAVHIEIGSGKGTFLLAEAQAYPQIDFLGIEWASRYCRLAVDRLGRWKTENVRLIRTEAASFLADRLQEKTIDCFHIYFPDPWPKKRHNKRRFFNDKNLELLLTRLKPKGVIKFVTDHSDYFQQVTGVIKNADSKIEQIDFVPAAGAKEGEYVGTNFERKYIIEKRPIYPVAMRKL